MSDKVLHEIFKGDHNMYCVFMVKLVFGLFFVNK